MPALPQRHDRVVQHLCPATRPQDPRRLRSTQEPASEAATHAKDPCRIKSSSRQRSNAPSVEDDPVVDGEVEPPQRGTDARHRQAAGRKETDSARRRALCALTGGPGLVHHGHQIRRRKIAFSLAVSSCLDWQIELVQQGRSNCCSHRFGNELGSDRGWMVGAGWAVAVIAAAAA